MNKIYCLFSVANLYDQPPHNLVAWWSNPPTVKDLIGVLGDYHNEEDLIKLALGEEYNIIGDVRYSVVCVVEGTRLEVL